MTLKLHRLAEAEIREAAIWYRGRAEGLDRTFLRSVRDALELLETDPRRSPTLETMPDASFRRMLLDRFPYVIVYEVVEDDVFVYAAAHASRRPNYWRRRKRN